jgi:hypothetical protein
VTSTCCASVSLPQPDSLTPSRRLGLAPHAPGALAVTVPVTVTVAAARDPARERPGVT